MKVSILTPSLNQEKYIEQNILSVLNQCYEDYEHIIIDGGSKDSTIQILKKYPHLKWVSEIDEGQADALNKGLKFATGDIIGWINSDDYYEPNIFNNVVNYFIDSKASWIIGDLIYYFNDLDKLIKTKSPKITYYNLLRDPDSVRQQPAFFKREFLNKLSGWDKKFYMVMDFDLWIRASKEVTPLMVNDNLANFRIHNNQKSNYNNSTIQRKEICTILIREGYPSYKIILYSFKKIFDQLKVPIKNYLLDLGILKKTYKNSLRSYLIKNK